MFKKIFGEIKDRAIEKSKEIAAEKANDFISQGKEYSDEKVNKEERGGTRRITF